jgi:hypothetical protein
VESTTVPNKQQRDIGRAAIDAGADLVIGTHPHSMQGIEFYRHGVIAYSLGNFVFTGASHKLAGCILKLRVLPERVSSDAQLLPQSQMGDARLKTRSPAGMAIELLPCWINDGRPTPSDDKRLRQELERIMNATGSTLKPIDAEDRWLSVEPR